MNPIFRLKSPPKPCWARFLLLPRAPGQFHGAGPQHSPVADHHVDARGALAADPVTCCGEMLYRLAIFSISSKAVSSSRKMACTLEGGGQVLL